MIQSRSIPTRRYAPLAAAACLFALAPVTRADVLNITNDTYIDSFTAIDPATGVDGGNDRTNYGSAPSVKAVTSAASTGEPTPSFVRTLLTLPASFWSSIGSGNVTSATVTYVGKTTSSLGGRALEIHPLTQSFVAGTGGSPTVFNSGSSNIPAAVGADFRTYDGTNAWATPGGDYDAANEATDTVSGLNYSWDITGLVNDPVTRAEMQNDGLIIKLFDDNTGADAFPSPQQFISFNSADGAAAAGNQTIQPKVTFTAVPEPTYLGLAVVGAVGLLRRRRAC